MKKEQRDEQANQQTKHFMKRMTVGCVLFAAGLLLLFAARGIPGMAEWYATHIYPVLVSIFGRISMVLPCSVSEVIIYILLVTFAYFFIRLVVRLIRGQKGKEAALQLAAAVFMTSGILLFIYTINCGINYHRVSFSEYEHMQTTEYTAQELKDVCLLLTEQVNQEALLVNRDNNGIMVVDGEVGQKAVRAMKQASNTYTCLQGYYPDPKWLVNPRILSYMDLGGVYSPFTVEANYNNAMVPYNLPFTACHELSHLRGFMQEEEANFIAYLACISVQEPDMRYSGSLMAWIYSTNVLQKVDAKAYQEVRSHIIPEVEIDLKANSKFWAEYEGKIAEVSNQMNDTYLKANGQSDGVASYDRMVDLLVAYYKQ